MATDGVPVDEARLLHAMGDEEVAAYLAVRRGLEATVAAGHPYAVIPGRLVARLGAPAYPLGQFAGRCQAMHVDDVGDHYWCLLDPGHERIGPPDDLSTVPLHGWQRAAWAVADARAAGFEPEDDDVGLDLFAAAELARGR